MLTEMLTSQLPATRHEIVEELSRLLNDPAFQASMRNKQFLRFVVEETLAGRGHRIKSYSIAVDVFGRPADFDSAVDPIVRIEASRLRASLAKYYERPDVTAKIKIRLPTGRYVPEFSAVRRSGVARDINENDVAPVVPSETSNIVSERLTRPVAHRWSTSQPLQPALFVENVEPLNSEHQGFVPGL
jgi:hypothetical protein